MSNLEHFIPHRDTTALIVVDIQEKFFPAMEAASTLRPSRKSEAVALLAPLLSRRRKLP